MATITRRHTDDIEHWENEARPQYEADGWVETRREELPDGKVEVWMERDVPDEEGDAV